MNSINIRALDGGFTVSYQVPNPKYVEPTADAAKIAYQPKQLQKTKVFTDTAALEKFVGEHLATLTPVNDDVDAYW